MKCIKVNRLDEFEQGILWNYVAMALMALNGFFCNFIIAYFYDASAVGLFNRIYSYYLVISQLSVFGIHMSLLHYIPTLQSKKEKTNSLLSALILTLFISLSVSGVLKISLCFLETKISNSTRIAFDNIMIALVLFAINKVIISYFNALSYMKDYAVLQAVRYVALGGSVLVFSMMHLYSEQLVLCFLISELVVFITGIIFLWRCKLCKPKIELKYITEHLSFGKRIFLSNIVLDLNTKVDIISLGLLLKNDYYIGIYSFAVMFIEGFCQVLVVIRRSINPKITQCYYKTENTEHDIQKARKFVDRIAVLIFGGILGGYYLLCSIMGKPEYLQGIISIVVMGLSIVITRKHILYGNVFSQIGRPEIETKINIGTVLVNIILNALLIPLLNINGAAIATSISYMAFAIFLNYYRKKKDIGLSAIWNI